MVRTTHHSGSTNSVDVRFQPFGFNDLELVDQNIASWNRIASWLRQIDGLNRSRYKSTGTSPPFP